MTSAELLIRELSSLHDDADDDEPFECGGCGRAWPDDDDVTRCPTCGAYWWMNTAAIQRQGFFTRGGTAQ